MEGSLDENVIDYLFKDWENIIDGGIQTSRNKGDFAVL